MTEEHKASRTIVKSPPELWAECSVAQSLARHLGEFGEIKITRLEPETTVAWEGEHASGTVRLEPSGWGTHVTLTATSVVIPEPVHEVVEPEVVEPEEPEGHEEVEEVDAPEEVEEVEEVKEDDAPEGHEEVEAVEEVEASDEEIAEHLPRWQVFARLWARLGRKPVSVEPEDAEGEDAEAEEARAAGEDESEEVAEESTVVAQEPTVVAEPEVVADEMPEAVADEPPAVEEPTIDAQALLVGALDSLGQAHHRPFSRA